MAHGEVEEGELFFSLMLLSSIGLVKKKMRTNPILGVDGHAPQLGATELYGGDHGHVVISLIVFLNLSKGYFGKIR